MDVEKLTALIVVEKIPRRALVKWINAEGQHWPSGEKDTVDDRVTDLTK